MQQLFGVSSVAELKRSNTLPAYVAVENENSGLLTSLIEQIRYERSDGAPMATRVIITDTPHF